MAKRHPSTGSAAVSIFLAILLLLITFSTLYFFIARTWWFPEAITAEGREVDAQFMRTLWITGITFVLSQVALAWAVVRYRSRGQRAVYSHGNNTMEILWTTITAVVFIALGFYAKGAWASLYFRPAVAGATQVEVIGEQFKWSFRYPGPDGQFGRYKTVEQAIQEGRGSSPWQLDPADAAGKDDLVMGPGSLMAVPVGREVELLLRAKDVTHSFFVRELRLKQDTVPGMIIRVHFTAEKVGRYEIVCAELCGLGHHTMRTFLLVLSPEDYEKWLKEQAE